MYTIFLASAIILFLFKATGRSLADEETTWYNVAFISDFIA